MRAGPDFGLSSHIPGDGALAVPERGIHLRAVTSRSLRASLAFAGSLTWQAAQAAACDTASIDGYPPAPVAQCVEAKMTVGTGGIVRCDGDLEQMATAGADAYAAKGNAVAAEYAGPIEGFFKVDAADPQGACAVSCVKLPIGTEIVDARAATTTPASKNAPRHSVYAIPREEVVPGESTYISRIIVAQSTIGPLVCMAVANWHNRAADQEFTFYAYYLAPPERAAGQQ